MWDDIDYIPTAQQLVTFSSNICLTVHKSEAQNENRMTRIRHVIRRHYQY